MYLHLASPMLSIEALVLLSLLSVGSLVAPVRAEDTDTLYLGCYRVAHRGSDAYDHHEALMPETPLTIELCTDYCRSGFFTFASIQDGAHCSCQQPYGFPTFGMMGVRGLDSDDECNLPCEGNASQTCGGKDHVASYVLIYDFTVDFGECHHEDPRKYFATELSINGSGNPQMECAEQCHASEYAFSALQGDASCFCGDERPASEEAAPQVPWQCCPPCTANSNCDASTCFTLHRVAPARHVQSLMQSGMIGILYATEFDFIKDIPETRQVSGPALVVENSDFCTNSSVADQLRGKVLLAVNPNTACGIRDWVANVQKMEAVAAIVVLPPLGYFNMLASARDSQANSSSAVLHLDLVMPTVLLDPAFGQKFADAVTSDANATIFIGDRLLQNVSGTPCVPDGNETRCVCPSGQLARNCSSLRASGGASSPGNSSSALRSDASSTSPVSWKPYHCSEQGDCVDGEEAPIAVDEDFTLNATLTARWSGWRSAVPITRYQYGLFAVKIVDDFLEEESEPLDGWTDVPDDGTSATDPMALPRSGLYSFILKVENQAGLVSCARKLVLSDRDDAVLRVNESRFSLSAANKDADSSWLLTNATGKGPIEFALLWRDAVSFNASLWSNWMAPIKPYRCGDDQGEVVPPARDNASVQSAMSDALFHGGVSRLELAEAVADDDGMHFEDFVRLDILAFAVLPQIFHPIVSSATIADGETYIAAVRVVDVFNRKYTMLAHANAVASAPTMVDLGLKRVIPLWRMNGPTSSFAGAVDLSFRAVDIGAGVKDVEYQAYVVVDALTKVTIQEGTINSSKVDTRSCVQSGFRDCYCTKTPSGEMRFLGCFADHIDLSLDLYYSGKVTKDFSVFLRLTASNFAGLTTEAVMKIWNSSSLHTDEETPNQQLPVIFGAMGAVLGIVILSAVVLACTRKKAVPPDDESDGDMKSEITKNENLFVKAELEVDSPGKLALVDSLVIITEPSKATQCNA